MAIPGFINQHVLMEKNYKQLPLISVFGYLIMSVISFFPFSELTRSGFLIFFPVSEIW